jgi:hypothetical protein
MKPFAEQKWIHNANVYWINGGRIIECIKSNVPYPIAVSEKRKLDHTNLYKPGLIVVVSALEKDQKGAVLKEVAKIKGKSK